MNGMVAARRSAGLSSDPFRCDFGSLHVDFGVFISECKNAFVHEGACNERATARHDPSVKLHCYSSGSVTVKRLDIYALIYKYRLHSAGADGHVK